MPTFALPGRPAARRGDLDPTLADARDSLAYWESRAQRLPRRAVRRRREAREMARRWRERVAEAERETYGRGLLGLALLVAAERRLPEPTRHAGRRVARRAAQLTVAVFVLIVALVAAAAATVVDVVASVL